MSFVATPPFGAVAPVQYGVDLWLNKATPGNFLQDTGVNGQLQAQQNINGIFWTIKNAYWNGASFVPVNTTLASYAWVQDASGNLIMYYSALVNGAAQNPLVWVQLFEVGGTTGSITSSGNITLPTTGTFGNINCQNITVTGAISGNIGVGSITNLAFIRAGSQASVLCDGTTPAANAITFSTPFPNTLQGAPTIGISAVSAAGQVLGAPQFSNLSVNGFTVAIPGAAVGTTCTITYWANGT